ncbi:hypothetical protein H4F99_00180 [Lysobacter sp. SG-8]|uniref:Uncharacterized protein n=2 Tax=Marilutibacter penaei TaxID=2759900 RepID=A0A7W3YDC2_9GAMM|nr:hypothetical protein [Lysobacter penaei]
MNAAAGLYADVSNSFRTKQLTCPRNDDLLQSMTHRSSHPQTAIAAPRGRADALRDLLVNAVPLAIAAALILVLVLITGPTSAGYGVA